MISTIISFCALHSLIIVMLSNNAEIVDEVRQEVVHGDEEEEDDEDVEDDGDDDDGGGDGDDKAAESMHQKPHRLNQQQRKQIDYRQFLSEEEIVRADAVYAHVLQMNTRSRIGSSSSSRHSATAEEEIDFQQFQVALSLLGQQESNDKLQDMFVKELQSQGSSSSGSGAGEKEQQRGKETIDKDTFKRLVAELRLAVVGADDHTVIIARIRDAFDALYEGTCELDDQRDEYGDKYIYAKALRQHLTTLGNALSDEEADELIEECHPAEVPNAEGVVQKRIYFEQFRSMLLDKGQ